MLDLPVRQLCSYAIITLFIVFFFSSGLSYSFGDTVSALSSSIGKPRFPDFSQYQELHTLSAQQFPIDNPNRRIIIVGDIHGTINSLTKLLEKVQFKSSSDVLIHVGDILTKGSHNGSMEVLKFMTSHNVLGVRGNHDQKVIEWRAWIAWIQDQPGGRNWFDRTLAQWKIVGTPSNDAWVSEEMGKKDRKWWKMVPPGWVLFGDHFTIAQAMDDGQYDYLCKLPLIIHVPSAHAYVVHAGLLPSDPKHPYNSSKQPLTRVPQIPKGRNSTDHETEMERRTLQELAVLKQVPQNVIPYNNLNIRGIVNGKVTQKSTGQPWSMLWQHDMQRCAGFKKDLPVAYGKEELLPCFPATVVYGHAASRGLDIKRWSIGLDSGCVYNRYLSALVLGSGKDKKASVQRDDSDDEEHGDEDKIAINAERMKHGVPFGASYHGKIISVSC